MMMPLWREILPNLLCNQGDGDEDGVDDSECVENENYEGEEDEDDNVENPKPASHPR